MKQITLSDEQNDCVNQMERHNKCKIIVATGVGKTFTQAEVFAREIKRCNLRGRNSVNVIKAGRRLLVDQLACEYAEYLYGTHGLKLNEHYLAAIVHTGEGVRTKDGKEIFIGHEEELIELTREERLEQLREGLEPSESDIPIYPKTISDRYTIAEMIQSRDLPILIFTTYHSNEKVGKIISLVNEEVEIDMNDEAHMLTFGVEDNVDEKDKRVADGYKLKWNELFHPNDSVYEPVRQYFHTATERTSTGNSYDNLGITSDGIGMDNDKRFGKQSHKLLITSRMARERRLILGADCYRINGADGSEYDATAERTNPDQFIEKALDIMEDNPICSRTALLVSLNGKIQAAQLYDMDEDTNEDPYADGTKPEWIQHMEEKYPGIQILSLFSHTNLIRHNGKRINRKQFMQALKKYGNSDCKFLLIHHDTLAEGIDVTGLHGVLFLRKVDVPKTIQTIGRVVRVDKNDRNKLLKAGNESQLKNIPEELWSMRQKKHGFVFWPNCADADTNEFFTNTTEAVLVEGIPLEGRVRAPLEKVNGRGPRVPGPTVDSPEDPISLGEQDLELMATKVEYAQAKQDYHVEISKMYEDAAEFEYVPDEESNDDSTDTKLSEWRKNAKRTRKCKYIVGKRFKYKDIWIFVKSEKEYVNEETGDISSSLNSAISKSHEIKHGKPTYINVWSETRDENGNTPQDICDRLHA